jgi:uncharacterized protein associated with vWA-MoxR-VMAP ternary system
MNVLRQRVFWYGPKPTNLEEAEFTNRGLHIEFPETANLLSSLPTTRGLVFKYNRDKPGSLVQNLIEFARMAIDHGLKIYVIADDESTFQQIRSSIGELESHPSIYQRISPQTHDAAETIIRHNPGPPENIALEIKLEGGTLNETERLFLRRTFSDCKSVLLQPLPGGRSGNVFSVYAVFEDSIVGPRPLPFFAKFDERHKIAREIENYKLYVSHFIPFNLRPNLDEYRCILGYDRGMIVGNFVEKSETLWEVALRGHAQQAIYSLFENTLRGWRLQADPAQKGTWRDLMRETFNPSRIPEDRLDLARQRGTTKQPQELIQILLGIKPSDYLTAPIHGDLHALNVRVRDTDAILIDFNSTRRGPLTADPASLEISIAFRVAGDDDDDEGWSKLMDTLYGLEFLEKAPPPAKEPIPREWLWSCVRQIRSLIHAGGDVLPSEYSITVAIYLLRHSTYPSDNEHDKFRKAYAYVLAEKIILALENKLGAAP